MSYINDPEQINSINGLTNAIKTAIDTYFESNYTAIEGDMITNINNCQSRINIKFENQQELEEALNAIDEIVREANQEVIDIVLNNLDLTQNINDYRVEVEILITDSRGQKNGFQPIGVASDPELHTLTESVFPLHALQIKVTNM